MQIENLNSLLWGRILLPLMIGVGVFLTIRLDFLQIRKFGKMFSLTIGKIFNKKSEDADAGLSPWETISTALASTIGTGCMIGVAFAIQLGGPGTVFWMWISALLGMVIKYSEIFLSVTYRKKHSDGSFYSGPMVYLREGVGSPFLATLFTVFCLCATFGMGCSIQANAITSSLKTVLGFDSYICGAFLTLVVGIVIFGGAKKIAVINAKLVPFMSLVYIGCCVIILFLRIKVLPSVFAKIFQEAFSISSLTCGVSSYGMFLAMKNGFAKGIFSNEAGLGSAPIAHGSGQSNHPTEQGIWGMFEVFFTTLVICTLTAFVILSSDSGQILGINAAQLTLYSFESSLPHFGGICVCLSTVLFSLSTILGWAFYGEICLRFLFKNYKKYLILYRVLYVIVLFVGSVGNLDAIWTISELVNAFMAIPNLIGVVVLSGKVCEMTKKS